MSRLFLSFCCLWLALNSLPAAVVVYVDEQGGLYGFTRPEINDPLSALQSLTTPPNAAESGRSLHSAILPGTQVLGLQIDGDTAVVGFSPEIIGSGLEEARLSLIFQQVTATLDQFGFDGSIRLEVAGKLLSDYLEATKPVPPEASDPVRVVPSLSSLGGRSIGLSPGHGYFWTGTGWTTQRPVYCSPLNQEDLHTLEMVQYLNTYLTQDGATTKPYRCLDKNFGTHSSGRPWWQMAGCYWTKQLGYPCSVYASSTGDCNLGSGGSESGDDIRARPLAADADNTDIYVSLHSNGFAGDCNGSCPSGTETYYDASAEHATWGPISQTLANNINNGIMAAVTGNADPTWTCHGACVRNANGSYGEIRIPNRAATLTEIGFHDTCDRDADGNHLRDNFFRSTAMWGMYKGICDYFGVAPTWAFYSDEIVTNDFPATMTPGSVVTVHITFRNRGVLWNDARLFKLGAVGDSDPFTATIRHNVGTEVGPNTTRTFTFTLTAPNTPGNYTTDWQMLREGVGWFGPALTKNITVSGIAGAPIITTQPQGLSVSPGASASFTVVATGSAPLSYQWRKNTINLSNGGNISGAASSTLIITNVQPSDAGNYSVRVSNTNGSSTSVDAPLALIAGLPVAAYTIDSGNIDSTSRSGSYVGFAACGLNAWYSFGVPGPAGSNCTVFNRDIRWTPPLPAYGFTGRGYMTASTIVPDTHATATVNFFAVDAGGNDLAGPISGSINECAFSCAWVTFFNGPVNVSSFAGFRSNTQNDGPPGAGGCNLACGTFPAAYSQMRIQAARWQYINDWTCLGGYASTNVSDTANRAFNEANLYLYPAVDITHGNHLTTALGLSGKTPGRVSTGDCNNTNTLDFKGNANVFGGNDNMDSYGFAWIFSPGGASPRILVGSDDGNRLWVNGTLRNSTNAARGLTRDQDDTGAVSLPVGWSRLLFKVHNFTSGFQGTVSLRNSTNANLNEPLVNVFDLGGFYSYGVGYEQDAWYPTIYLSNFYGAANPQPNHNFYGNDTTVTASGTAAGGGPVPFWKVMHYEWGYALSGDSDYSDVNSSGPSWSHTALDVTGHRRFHFFAVSQSGRTSFQNNGQAGGSNWTAGGAANYVDVYIDNLEPQLPGFANAIASSTSQINLAWAIPLDQGVGIGDGGTESADEASNASGNYYRVGDVGVQLSRNGTAISPWTAAVSLTDTGLVANTMYTYTLDARDNSSELRGIWHNSTSQQDATNVWTLSVPPTGVSVTASATNPPTGSTITWTAVGGFGPGTIEYYRYAWDQSPTHSWTETETQWTNGALATVASSAGTWYLHVKGYNGQNVGNGSYDYPIAALNSGAIVASIQLSNQIVTITWSAVAGETYRVQFKHALEDANWTDLLPDVTAIESTGSKSEPLTTTERFYRVKRVN